MSAETQTCPRRQEVGSWHRDAGLDRWERRRWGSRLSREWIRFWHGDAKSRAYRLLRWWTETVLGRLHGNRTFDGRYYWRTPYLGGTRWEWPWKPRSCSFCGSVHPSDLLQLVREGWTLERAKAYKWYVYPPGYRAAMVLFLAAKERAVNEARTLRRDEFPTWWSPVPPVKLYTMHLDEATARQINEARVG